VDEVIREKEGNKGFSVRKGRETMVVRNCEQEWRRKREKKKKSASKTGKSGLDGVSSRALPESEKTQCFPRGRGKTSSSISLKKKKGEGES